MSLLSEEIPSYEELILEEGLPPLNLKLIIDCVSSVPLYERLDIDLGSFCEDETKLMDLQAEEYYNKISNLTNKRKIETHKDNFIKSEPEYSQIEEGLDVFLKNFYNCSDDDELLIGIQGNMSFDEIILESNDEVQPCTPSKEFLQFLLDTNDGKHDNLVVYEAIPSHDLSSDGSSDEKDEIREEKIKALSNKFKFSDSSNSKFLEPIINASKFSPFEIISESSGKIPTLKKEEIFLSDSETENDLKKKNLVFEDDKRNNEQLPLHTKKNLKDLKKKREKKGSREDKSNLKKNNESKYEEKKAIENIKNPRSHSNISTIDQTKINLDSFTVSTSSTNALAGPRQLTNANENLKKVINKKQVNNETSSSGDENWEELAEKNLFLRSKTLGQKVAKKK
ncbi:intermembrane lipid transfer protein vps13l-like [Halyomorpha halys]|uniref:intermembrane lipid transfer protein vps13l-like n=1 Tax=Halyomorpha halys TaxID=286706 RepID=UPI0034D2363D